MSAERRAMAWIALSLTCREYPASIRVVSSKDLHGGGLRQFVVHLEALDQNNQ
jgi:hypothetical protein